MMNTSRLLEYVSGFELCRVAVIGDLMLDEYVWGHIERISPEAPVPILNVVRRESTLGGAGNVVENLRSLGVQVTAFGAVGVDEVGSRIRELLTSHGVNSDGILCDPRRNSTLKIRLMSLEHGRQVFRLDEECPTPVAADVENLLIKRIQGEAAECDGIICSDYMKGVLTHRVLEAIFAVARASGIRTIVAPKDTNARRYRGAHVLMPNAHELAQLMLTAADGDGWLDSSARRCIEDLNLQALLVTRGSEGMSLFEKSETGLQRSDIPTTARSVYDVTGAGDTAIAAFVAGLAAGCDLLGAARLANVAAGIKVGKRGTASVSLAELMESIEQQPVSTQLSTAVVRSKPPSDTDPVVQSRS